MSKKEIQNNKTVLLELKTLIEESKQQIAVAVNSTMSMLYWNIGKRINTEILQNKRAEYGQQIVATLSDQLTKEYGKGWGEKNLRHMLRFAEVFPEKEIVLSLIRQLSWTHILAIIPIEEPLKREFYIEICKIERWSVRTFRERINSMLFERTAISKKPAETIKGDLEQLRNKEKISPNLIFRDPYFLDFLGFVG